MIKINLISHKSAPFILLIAAFILSVFDLVMLAMPLRLISSVTVFGLLAATLVFLYLVHLRPPLGPSSMLRGTVIMASLFGAYMAGVISIFILKLNFTPQKYHYIILFFSVLLLMFTGNRIFSRSLRNLRSTFHEAGRPENRQTITPITVWKIEQAVTYLRENYKHDISREGLAEHLGLSVDHLSRKFKAYKGRRIGDYINELRVKDAAERLRESEDRVIDIAYDNGFESLATFNRVFLKNIGEPPSDYRKRFRRQTLCAPEKSPEEINQLPDQPFYPQKESHNTA